MMHNHPQDVGVTHWKPGSGNYNNDPNKGTTISGGCSNRGTYGCPRQLDNRGFQSSGFAAKENSVSDLVFTLPSGLGRCRFSRR